MTYGGSCNPSAFCALSETIFDLSNELVTSPEWDKEELKSPVIDQVPEIKYANHSNPPEKALPMLVEIPTTANGRTDTFIDNNIRVFLNVLSEIKKQFFAIPLAIFSCMRPHGGNEKELITRRENISEAKH